MRTRTRLFTLALVACALCTQTACPKPDTRVVTSLSTEQAVGRLTASANRRLRLAGQLKGHLPGLAGMVGSVDLDVIAEPAGNLSVAVRSFFEQPLLVLATNGTTASVVDTLHSRFLKGLVNDRTLARVLPLPVRPEEVVGLLLGRAPVDTMRARLDSVDDEHGTYDTAFEAPRRGRVLLTARTSDDAIVRWRSFRTDGRPVLDVAIDVPTLDVKQAGDIAWARSWHVQVFGDDPQDIELESVDVVHNGPAVDASAYVLEPPPGVTAEPL
jgi:hypothetical protein